MSTNETTFEEDSSYGPLGNPVLVAVSPKIPALLSLIASYVLLREVVVDLKASKARTSKTLLRILFSMSVADIFFSIPWVLTTWMAPAELDYLWGNVGTSFFSSVVTTWSTILEST